MPVSASTSLLVTMMLPESSIPKFGNWDVNADQPISVAFERVRVQKQNALHHLNAESQNASSDKSISSRSYGAIQNKVPKSSLLPKTNEKNSRPLDSFEQDKRYVNLGHHAQRTSEDVSDRVYNDGAGTRNHGNSDKGCLSWQQTVHDDHYRLASEHFFYHHRADVWNPSRVQTYDPFSVPAFSSNLSKQSEGTKGTKNRADPFEGHKEYQRGRKTEFMNSAGSWMDNSQEGLTTSKSWGPNQSSHASSEKSGRLSVPKFGNWDDGNGYTAIFDTVRRSKSSRTTSIPTLEPYPDKDHHRDLERSVDFKPCKPQKVSGIYLSTFTLKTESCN
ncbi:hypothetical protein KP509_01G116300 [Ceratopteris richardii]|uniref:RIN4 pathogenic type III effector avirulence factor Avr cleavage site domain-containing protein n=1 Tax=Ceratopteris richardii TaxID=49495 RepID=A0A8T2VQ88_CERRI|nr:hypothetical protein KP509_01G116300 [Ceratopteris richardii]